MRSPKPGHAHSGNAPTSHSKAMMSGSPLPVATLFACSGSTRTSMTTSEKRCVDGKSPLVCPCIDSTVPLTGTGSESTVCPFTIGAHSGLIRMCGS